MSLEYILIILVWAIGAIFTWHAHEEFVDDIKWWQGLELILVVLLFGPAIMFASIGIEIIGLIFCQDELDKYLQEAKELKIAVVQFGEIDRLDDSRLLAATARAQVHWYYFDDSENREFAIADLKQHYDMVLEVTAL